MLRLVGENLPADYSGPAPSLPGPAEAQTVAEMAGEISGAWDGWTCWVVITGVVKMAILMVKNRW